MSIAMSHRKFKSSALAAVPGAVTAIVLLLFMSGLTSAQSLEGLPRPRGTVAQDELDEQTKRAQAAEKARDAARKEVDDLTKERNPDPPRVAASSLPLPPAARQKPNNAPPKPSAKDDEIRRLKEQLEAWRAERDSLKAAAADLAGAREGLRVANTRIAQLESELKALREGGGASTLRAERDLLKRELDQSRRVLESERADTANLRQDLQTAQAEITRLTELLAARPGVAPACPPAPLCTMPAPSASTLPSPPASPSPKATLHGGQALTVPGCGEKCPTLIALPHLGPVTMGTGSEARTVEFKHRLAAGRTEITVAQWRHFIDDSEYQMQQTPNTYCNWESQKVSEGHPVRCVNAIDADAYVAWFNRKYGAQLGLPKLQAVLPSHDEWEFAARAGRLTQERQWDSGINGGKENCEFATTYGCPGSTPDEVAKTGRMPNAFGLYDMIGNVWEWTSAAEGSGASRGIRGGSFLSGDYDLRLSARFSDTAGLRNYNGGFRLFARIPPRPICEADSCTASPLPSRGVK